jgi:hypothetical protein
MQRLTISLVCAFAFILSAAADVPSRTPEPLVVDVQGDGYRFTSPENGVMFDLDGTGTPQRVASTDAGSDDAFLALDHNHNGRIDGGRELFGGPVDLPASANSSRMKASSRPRISSGRRIVSLTAS